MSVSTCDAKLSHAWLQNEKNQSSETNGSNFDLEREATFQGRDFPGTGSTSSFSLAEGTKNDHALERKLGDAHVNLLPRRKLIICMLGMSVSLFTCFCDQTSVTVALPKIGKDLNAENSINWAGTSSLLANCVCQVLFGRFADIFGRKNMLIACLGLLCIANMLCGFAQTGPQFYVFRAFAGIGAGGAQSLSMVIVSDIVTLKQRGKFQGILGANVGMGNAIGPIIMAAYAQKTTWRDFYRTLPPVIAVVMVVVYFFVDNSKKHKLTSVLTTREKLRKIDYYGVFFSTAGLTLLLIPISGGGSTYAWDSTIVIVMFCVGGVCTLIFLLVEWKIPELPMIPLYIFKNISLSILLGTTFLYGMVYFGFLFIISYYYQLVKGYSEMRSAVLLLPLVLIQAFMSTLAGNAISLMGHFLPIMYSGYLFWLTGCGMTIAWKEDTSVAMIAGTLLIMGTGVGFIFQPTMVAAQANSMMAQRAVVISTRNVLRSFGGALGVAIASLIITNSLLKEINQQLEKNLVPKQFLYQLKQSIYSRADTSLLTADQAKVVRSMYMKSIRHVFYFSIPLIAVCLLSTFFVKDNGLRSLDQKDQKKPVEEKSQDTVEKSVNGESEVRA